MENKIRFGILTVSDRCSRGETIDESGKSLVHYIQNEFDCGIVIEQKCVPDEILDIKTTLLNWSRSDNFDVILTTGGTGFSPRDVTPEATKLVIDKEAPGMVIAMIKGSLDITPLAMLSRPVCGVRNNTLIINLPGSIKGSIQNLKIVIGPIKHAVHLLRSENHLVDEQHRLLNNPHIEKKSKVDGTKIADRARKSKFVTEKVTDAQDMILNECTTQIIETVHLNDGLGYILAQNVIAKDPLPPFRASIKDGYAVRTTSTVDVLCLTGDSTAGENPNLYKLEDNYCIRISTGAPVPEGADAVVQVEDTELLERTDDGKEEKKIKILKKPTVGQDIRAVGSDIQENELVLQKGTRIGPSELGILAAVGVAQFQVYRKPVVALLSTGNELQSPSEPIVQGKIRDSNKTTLAAVLCEAGYKTVDIGIAKDTPDEVYQKIHEGLSIADVLVSTGGVSMGERDFLKEVLSMDFEAKIHFGSVLMKPGKPTTFATCTLNSVKKLVFSLPGNPVSATVTAHLFVIPACRQLAGFNNPFHSTIKVKIEKNFKLDVCRPEYHRVRIYWTPDSPVPVAQSTGNQISSRLLSCNSANGLLVLPQGTPGNLEVTVGSILDALIISSL